MTVDEHTLCASCAVPAGEHAHDAAGNLLCPHTWTTTHFTPTEETDPMAAQTTITATADDMKTGATLTDVARFVEEASRAGIDPDTPVRITAGFRGQLRQIEVAG